MQNKKGFSLISLLITVLIVAILATIVLKKYQTINAMERTRLQQALQPEKPTQLEQSAQPVKSAQHISHQKVLQQVRSSIQGVEKSAAHADLFNDMDE